MLENDGAVLIEPPYGDVRRAIDARRARGATESTSIAVRQELGLESHGPVVMSGHQAYFWHPGIVAKWFAVEAIAADAGGIPAWVVVDHDTDDPLTIEYPANSADRGIHRSSWRWGVSSGSPPCAQPPAHEIAPIPSDAISIPEGAFNRAREAIVKGAKSDSLAGQVASATATLLAGRDMRLLFASGLGELPAFRAWAAEMARDPESCVRAYNHAVHAHPGSGMRPLSVDEVNDRWELPLWRLVSGKERQRVFAEDLQNGDLDGLAPRALLLTAFLRAYACDLFIHGIGGGVYDRVTEAWFSQWKPGVTLAPTMVVSATLHLELTRGLQSARTVSEAVWQAHHALHNPSQVGDQEGQQAKQRLVSMLASHPRRSRERREAFAALHTFLDQHRVSAADAMKELTAQVGRARSAEQAAELSRARDWAFFLYPQESLAGLRRRIAALCRADA